MKAIKAKSINKSLMCLNSYSKEHNNFEIVSTIKQGKNCVKLEIKSQGNIFVLQLHTPFMCSFLWVGGLCFMFDEIKIDDKGIDLYKDCKYLVSLYSIKLQITRGLE